jgi:hypothetical protein
VPNALNMLTCCIQQLPCAEESNFAGRSEVVSMAAQ